MVAVIPIAVIAIAVRVTESIPLSLMPSLLSLSLSLSLFLAGGSSYRGSRDGQYRGASRGNGGSSNYSPY